MPSPLSRRPNVTNFHVTVWIGTASLLLGSLPLSAQDRGERPGRTAPVTAIHVGKIHPVSGPAIDDGVILIARGRILRVGTAAEVPIPQGAEVLKYPAAHAYPGLVDALSTAFAGPKELADAAVDAGTDFADALDPSHEPSQELIRHGITTAYVSNRSNATWRGRGAIIRPQQHGFDTLRNKRHGGVSLRMTTGEDAGHALDRLKRFDSTGAVFDSLEAYEKQRKDYEKAIAEYEKAFQAYVDHHRKKSGKGSAAPGGAGAPKAGTEGGPQRGDGERRGSRPGGTGAPPERRDDPGRRDGPERGDGPGRRDGPGRGGAGRGDGRRGFGRRRTPDGTPAPASAPAGANPASQEKGATAGSGAAEVKRPTYPKRVEADAAKDALLAVVHGELPLRIEVHRTDEIRAAMLMAMLKELPGIALEFASDGGEIAAEVAQSGAPVIVTGLLPSAHDLLVERDPARLPARLHAAGVPVAIGSGDLQSARNLTMMAALACGHGLPEDAAVRALTLTPAKILRIDDRVGSLAPNKVADVLITSGPLLRSDTKVLRVISRGQTQYEAR